MPIQDEKTVDTIENEEAFHGMIRAVLPHRSSYKQDLAV